MSKKKLAEYQAKVLKTLNTLASFDNHIVLTPVRIHRADAIRVKLAKSDLEEKDIANAVDWARSRKA